MNNLNTSVVKFAIIILLKIHRASLRHKLKNNTFLQMSVYVYFVSLNKIL